MKRLFFLVLLVCSLSFGQKLEEKIYVSVDEFVANPTEKSIEKLIIFEKTIQPKTNGELLAFVILNCNKAYFQNQFGDTKNAILSYEKAWQIFNKYKLQEYDIVEFCLKPLGNLYTIIGDFESAENTIKQYLFIATKQNNEQQKISGIQNLANVYQSSGKNEIAINLLKKTIESEKITNVEKGILLNNLGVNYLGIKNYKSAKIVLLKAIKLLENDKNQTETLSNSYRNLATIFSLENNFTQANLCFNKAKNALFLLKKIEPRKLAKFYLEEGQLLYQQNRFDESEKSIQLVFKVLLPNYNDKEELPNKNSLFAETILIDAFDLQAEIFLAKKQPKKALLCYTFSFYIADLLQTMLVYENSKIVSQINNRDRTEKCIAIYEYLYKTEGNSSYIECAFQLAEKTKSSVLKANFKQNETISKSQKLALEQLQNQNTIIIKEQQKGNIANLETINKAIKKQNELMLFIKSNTQDNSNKSIQNLDLKMVFDTLEKDKAVLISYFSGNENLYCFTFNNKQIKLQKLDYSLDSKQKISSFLDYFSNADEIANDVSGYNDNANTLFFYLQLPKKQQAKNLIISPDGLLNFVPFEALITKKTATNNFAKLHYLINDFSIGYTSSVSFYINEKQGEKKEETVLGIFPIFENSDLELSYSKNELKAIRANFKGNYLENKQATFNNFKKNANQFSILHLSTHANSGDELNPASIRFYDKEILYSELYSLDIKPNLVVLSACETGLGKLYKGEGSMSVARGFQMAGAQNLLFSLWKVNDYTTSVFMEKFYKNIKNGNSYFEANHKAKLDFLNDKTISNFKKSPYYWCSIVYYGRLENSSESHWWIWIVLGTLALLTLVYLIKYKKFQLK